MAGKRASRSTHPRDTHPRVTLRVCVCVCVCVHAASTCTPTTNEGEDLAALEILAHSRLSFDERRRICHRFETSALRPDPVGGSGWIGS